MTHNARRSNRRKCSPQPSSVTGHGNKSAASLAPTSCCSRSAKAGSAWSTWPSRSKPVRRMVALKIIKPGMDTAQVIARFESERQALALMDHPNIAKVLDAGATDSGRPYFVMELVKGVPITEFCDKNHLPPEARLKLFIDVCHAIQHAHHKGIIHRDIKPSNVMVTLHDGVPVVKVIDFGVAKATVQKLTERDAVHRLRPDDRHAGLHEPRAGGDERPGHRHPQRRLLAGRAALRAVDRHDAAGGQAACGGGLRRDAAADPRGRSAAAEHAACRRWGTRPTVLAGNRGLDVKRLAQLLAGDLDWIVMKALEKDRNRRYGTPGSFAEDIERYLRHEAILARPPSQVYRLKKFAQRNRAAVLTAAVVAVALLAGTAVATWQAFRATRAPKPRLWLLPRPRKLLRSRERGERGRVGARGGDQGGAGVRGEPGLRCGAARGPGRGPGPRVTLRKAIESALPFVDQSFPNQPLIEARLRLTLGRSFYFLGDAQTAAEQEEAARTLYTRHRGPDHPDTLMSMNNLADQLPCPRPARRGPQAPRRDAGAAEGQARPRPPRHAREHEQPGQQLR